MDTDIKVLLIEDSFSDAQMVEAIIASSDLGKSELSYAGRFEEALTLLEQKSYDLILLDLHLPDGEGLDLIRQLRQKVPKTPVVVLTGIEDETVAVAAILEGAQDYLTKSDAFSLTRLSGLGATGTGNLLVRRIQHALKDARSTKRLEIEQAQYALATGQEDDEDGWDWDLKNNRIYLSPRWQSLLGIYGTSLGIAADEWIARIHVEDRAHFERTLQDYLEHRRQQIRCEYRIQHAEGHYIWILTRGKALRDQFGKTYRIVGSQSDISVGREEETVPNSKEVASTVLYAVGAGLLSLQAMLYVYEDRYDDAESLLQSTLEMRRALLGSEHLDVAASLYNLASLYDNQFRFQEAEVLFKEALTIFQKILGSEHSHTRRINAKVTVICRLNQTMGLLRKDLNEEGS